jgi:hypothetical protein
MALSKRERAMLQRSKKGGRDCKEQRKYKERVDGDAAPRASEAAEGVKVIKKASASQSGAVQHQLPMRRTFTIG